MVWCRLAGGGGGGGGGWSGWRRLCRRTCELLSFVLDSCYFLGGRVVASPNPGEKPGAPSQTSSEILSRWEEDRGRGSHVERSGSRKKNESGGRSYRRRYCGGGRHSCFRRILEWLQGAQTPTDPPENQNPGGEHDVCVLKCVNSVCTPVRTNKRAQASAPAGSRRCDSTSLTLSHTRVCPDFLRFYFLP